MYCFLSLAAPLISIETMSDILEDHDNSIGSGPLADSAVVANKSFMFIAAFLAINSRCLYNGLGSLPSSTRDWRVRNPH